MSPLARRSRLAPLAALALLACGEPRSAPEPFAALAGTYELQTVNARALPFGVTGGSWLFERRFEITGAGRYQQFDVYCIQSGDSCPRRESASSGSMIRSGDGTLWFDYGPAYQAPATFDPSGRLEIAVTDLRATGSTRTNTFRYQRR